MMVWGGMTAAVEGNLVFIDDRMDHMMYLVILQNNLRTSERRLELENQWIF